MCSFRRAVSLSRDSANHLSRSAGEGPTGAGGTRKFLIRGESVSHSVSDHLGRLGLGIRVGWARLIVIGTWSEPVEGRETSHHLNNGRRRGFAKARSMTEGRALPTQGNLVYSPGGLRRPKPASAGFSKKGVEDPISRGKHDYRRSERGLCILRSPTTKRGTSKVGNRKSGGTEWTRWSRVLVE